MIESEEELKEYMDRVFNGLELPQKSEKDNIKDLLLSAFDEVSISEDCIKMLMKKELDSIMNSVYFKLSAVDYKITDISLNKKTISEEDRRYYSLLKDYVDVIKKQVCFISDENMWDKSYYRGKEMETIEHLQEHLKNILAKEKGAEE